MKKKVVAWILLALLLIVPFIDWRLGALIWMSAWLVFIFQKLFARDQWNLGDGGDQQDVTGEDDEGEAGR